MQEQPRRRWLVLVAAAVLIAIVVGVGLAVRRDRGPTAAAPGVSIDATAARTAAPDAAQLTAAISDAVPATATEPLDLAAKVAACRKSRDTEDWINVITCAKGLPDGTSEAAGLIEQAHREARSKLELDALTTAAREQDYPGAIDAMKKIPPDSIYAQRARVVHDRLRDQFILDEVAKAHASAAHHDCRTKDKRAREIWKLWKEAAAAVNDVRCGGE